MLCDLQIFSGGVYPPSTTSRTISFLFRIIFGIKFNFFFLTKVGLVLRLVLRAVRLSPTRDTDNLGENKKTTTKVTQARSKLSASSSRRRRSANARLRASKARYGRVRRANHEFGRKVLLDIYNDNVAHYQRSLEELLMERREENARRDSLLDNCSKDRVLTLWEKERTLNESIEFFRQRLDESERNRRKLLQEDPNLPKSYFELSDDEGMECDSETDGSASGGSDADETHMYEFDEEPLRSTIKSAVTEVLTSTSRTHDDFPARASVAIGETSSDKGVFFVLQTTCFLILFCGL